LLTTLAIAGYRSLRELIVPLARLNVITGPNGTGKSSVYRALRLLAATVIGATRRCGLAECFATVTAPSI
jgi:predicted ATPase